MSASLPIRAAAANCRGLFLAAGLLGLALSAGAACAADDGQGVLKLELGGNLVPVPGPNIGWVYSHYDSHLDRRVWALYEGNGRFSIAMGAGSSQPARAFGYSSLSRDAIELLRRRDPKLAEEVSREGTEVFLKLGANQRWTLTRTKVPLIYNDETGERWEMQFGKYMPVGHMGGFSWARRGNGYTPVYSGPWVVGEWCDE